MSIPVEHAAVPRYPWENIEEEGYHINGTISSSSILEERVIPFLNQLPKGSFVADFGCGEGRVTRKSPHFARRPYIFVGYEINPAAVASLNRFTRGFGYIPDRVEVADLTRLEVRENRFHAGILWRVLHSIPQKSHEVVLQQIFTTLRIGSSLHIAALSERDWKRIELEKLGLYQPGAMNDCYPVMAEALKSSRDTKNWNLYFFRERELASLGQRVGFEVVHQQPIQEESGFKILRETYPPLSYDYLELVKK